MKHSEYTVVVYSINEAYVLPCLVSIVSLLRNFPGIDEIQVLCHGVSEHSKEQLRSQSDAGRVKLVDIHRDEFDSLPKEARLGGDAVYGRLQVVDWLPAQAGRVLYLDADTLILRGLHPLFAIGLDDVVLAAAVEQYAPTVADVWGLAEQIEAHASATQAYFNSGVLLVNRKFWHEADIGRNARLLLEGRGNWKYPDQDALNAAVRGRWLTLDPIYNCTDYWFSHRAPQGASDVTSQARILHFSGAAKPWEAGSVSTNLEQLWHSYAQLVSGIV